MSIVDLLINSIVSIEDFDACRKKAVQKGVLLAEILIEESLLSRSLLIAASELHAQIKASEIEESTARAFLRIMKIEEAYGIESEHLLPAPDLAPMLGNLLHQAKITDRFQIAAALLHAEESKKKLGQSLLMLELVSPKQLAESLEIQSKVLAKEINFIEAVAELALQAR
ncbi:MAG: hypothetical protein K2X27_06830 [Candidatus Obscuribacterales bacterium]|nr:hypothetical protein [Candidatus Obscuribacterales bacterium]